MAIRKIVLEDDNVLRKKSKKVTDYNENLHVLLDDMKETMIAADGIGIAAIQVGVLKRAIIINVNNIYLEMINPEIEYEKETQICQEGCLSIPNKTGYVKRPKVLCVNAYDRHGEPYSIKATGMLAVVISHEIDHLEGVLFTDKVLNDDEIEDYL